MKLQNITLSLPKNVLRKLKILTFQRNLSISHLIIEAIEKMLAEETNSLYEEACIRQIALMHKGIDLGIQKSFSRDDLHD